MNRSEDVADALTAVATFQSYVQHADEKVNILLMTHAGAAASVAATSALGPAHSLGTGIGWAMLTLYAAGSIVSGYHLLRTLRPSLTPPAIRSHYGISHIADEKGSSRGVRSQSQRFTEAWAMAHKLGRIAEAKHRRIAKAVPWTGLSLVSAVIWIALNAAVG
ncbi:hypothetical protein ABZ897_07760 [Nonomuraea sp. NPDC046802]|uniref:hypothetical protein n=1 Tax=Nonomuraea sp. NPDC046802 TaxID=3154919 RepID=UPI0033D8CAF0